MKTRIDQTHPFGCYTVRQLSETGDVIGWLGDTYDRAEAERIAHGEESSP